MISTANALNSSSGGVSLPRACAQRDFQIAYSDNLPSILAGLNCSLLVSTYRTGNLVSLAARDGRLDSSFHTFERPMGIAVKDSGIAVGTRTQVWFLRSTPDIAAKLEPRGRYDAGYLARYSHFTGDVHCHDIAWAGGELWIVNTLFSCLCSLHSAYNFAPRWRPSFISALVPEDRCHLNGLAVADDQPRFVTAMAACDEARGWRAMKVGGGCIIDVSTGELIARGLIMPHSPRMTQGRLYFLQSGCGTLEQVDPASGGRTLVCRLPGYTRGLGIAGRFAFVGLSKIRPASDWSGVPIAEHPDRLKCGVWVVDLLRGTICGFVELVLGAEELFDVQVIPGVAHPYLSGPLEEQALWTVMPTR
jgi:uncharacterized protein (TIGR03032 family)